MTLDFSTIFITGATSGLGFELAKYFLSKDARVIAIGRNQAKLQELQGLGAITQELDLSKSEDIILASNLITRSQPDLVYHAAGSTFYGHLCERSQEDLVQEIKLHLESTTLLLQSFGNLPEGKRLFMGFSSAVAYTPIAGMSLYSSCKRAIWTLCRLCDIEYKSKGFRVLSCQPGPVLTDFHTRASKGSYEENSLLSISTEQAIKEILWQTQKEISSLPIGPMAWIAKTASMLLPFRLIARTLYKKVITRVTRAK